MWTTLALTLALTAPANAGNLSVDVARATIAMPDPNWDLYSYSDNLAAWGLRAGYAVTPWLAGSVGYGFAVDGGELILGDDEYAGTGITDMSHALVTHQLALGPKFILPVLSWAQPYATVQGVAMLGRDRLDDDIDDDENLNELRATGFTGGALAAGGVEIITRRVDRAVRPSVRLEVGYAWLAPLQLGDLGQLQIHGLYTQWGVGAHF